MTQTPTDTPTRWVETLPLDVRLALAACEFEGVGIDEYSTGSHEPVFYEVKAPFLGCPASMGTIMGMVTDAIRAECNRYAVPNEHTAAIIKQVRHDAISGDYNTGLNKMMCWVGVATDED